MHTTSSLIVPRTVASLRLLRLFAALPSVPPASVLRALCVRALCPLCLISVATVARADFTITRTSVFDVDQLVPDTEQYFNRQETNLGGFTILDVNVGVVLTGLAGDGAYAGDYYVHLAHTDAPGAYAVLLNGIGRTDTDGFGSNANGLNVTLDDSAAAGDIHSAPFDPTSLAPSALTGTWAPDAREIDIASVTTGSPRTAFLSNFNGLSTDGEWRLLVADDSAGASARLTSWSLSITYAPDSSALSTLTATDILTVPTGTLDLSASPTIQAHIVNQGTIVGPTAPGEALTLTGQITGAGNFQGNFILLGSYSPGNSPTAATFTGNTVFGPAHILTLEIGGTAPGTEYDTVSVSGGLTRGGVLNVVFINGFIPAPSDFFRFFAASSFGGSFFQINLPAGFIASRRVDDDLGFSLSAVPEPAATAATLALFAAASVLWRRPRRQTRARPVQS